MVCQEFCLKCLGHHWDRWLGDHVGEAFVDSIRNITEFLVSNLLVKPLFDRFVLNHIEFHNRRFT